MDCGKIEPMSAALRVLLIEDSPDDAALIVAELRRADFDPTYLRVQTSSDARNALSRDWDVILCDYSMPRFGPAAALRLVKECGLHTPVLIVCAHILDESAIALMRQGASDVILKNQL